MSSFVLGVTQLTNSIGVSLVEDINGNLLVSPKVERGGAVVALHFADGDESVPDSGRHNNATGVLLSEDLQGFSTDAQEIVKKERLPLLEYLDNVSTPCGSFKSKTRSVSDAEYRDAPMQFSPATRNGVVSTVSTRRTCTDDGLIVASANGFLLIKVYEGWQANRVFRWLGNNPKHPCVLRNIGEVKQLRIQDGIPRGNPALWAFEERKRMFWVASQYQQGLVPTASSPMLQLQTTSRLLLPIYGSHSDIQGSRGHSWRSPIGGTLALGSAVQFGYNTAILFLQGDSFIDANIYTGDGLLVTDPFISWKADDWKGPQIVDIVWEAPCNVEVQASETVLRLHELQTQLRVCEYGLKGLKWDAELAVVAKDWAEQQIVEGIFGHYDSEGHDVTDRVGNLEYLIILEIVSKQFQEKDLRPQLDKIIDKTYDDAFNGWVGSEQHLAALIDGNITHMGFGCAFELIIEDGMNIGLNCIFVGVGRKTEHEQENLSRVLLSGWDDDDVLFPKESMTYAHMKSQVAGKPVEKDLRDVDKCLRGFSSAPRIQQKVSFIAHKTVSNPYYFVPNHPLYNHCQEFPLWVPDTIVGGGAYSASSDFNFFQKEDLRVSLRDSGDHYNPAIYYLEYARDALAHSVYVKLTENRCSLHVALGSSTGIEVDFSYEFTHAPQGEGRYSGIIVGSIFHTCPPKTAEGTAASPGEVIISYCKMERMAYTRPSVVSPGSVYNQVDSVSVDIHKYHVKSTYWAVVVDAQNQIVSQFRLGGFRYIPEDLKNGYWGYMTEEIAADGLQESFHFQFNGPLQLGTVQVKYIAGGENYTVYDEGEATFPTAGNTIATSTIDYNTGEVSITFGTPSPDNLSVVSVRALVFDFAGRYEELEMHTELTETYPTADDPDQGLPSYHVGMTLLKGHWGFYPSLTLTQDGQYIVWEYKAGNSENNMYYKNQKDDSENGIVIISSDNVYELWDKQVGRELTLLQENTPPQCVVYDRQGTLVAGPEFITADKLHSDAVVLN